VIERFFDQPFSGKPGTRPAMKRRYVLGRRALAECLQEESLKEVVETKVAATKIERDDEEIALLELSQKVSTPGSIVLWSAGVIADGFRERGVEAVEDRQLLQAIPDMGR
jgi:hypothetical protein